MHWTLINVPLTSTQRTSISKPDCSFFVTTGSRLECRISTVLLCLKMSIHSITKPQAWGLLPDHNGASQVLVRQDLKGPVLPHPVLQLIGVDVWLKSNTLSHNPPIHMISGMQSGRRHHRRGNQVPVRSR